LKLLQAFDVLTRSPYLAQVNYHERAQALAYAQHFGAPLTGEGSAGSAQGGGGGP
jgi:hypothetical protein